MRVHYTAGTSDLNPDHRLRDAIQSNYWTLRDMAYETWDDNSIRTYLEKQHVLVPQDADRRGLLKLMKDTCKRVFSHLASLREPSFQITTSMTMCGQPGAIPSCATGSSEITFWHRLEQASSSEQILRPPFRRRGRNRGTMS